jgi:hypothetical protein
MPAPTYILRPLAEQYRTRFGVAIPECFVRRLPMQELVARVLRSLQTGSPLDVEQCRNFSLNSLGVGSGQVFD